MRHTRTTYGIASLVALAGLATACSDSTSVKTSSSQLAFTTGPKLGALADAAPITINGHTLVLSAVTITVSRAELKPASSAVCADDNEGANDNLSPSASASADGDHNGSGSDDCGEMKIGPTSIDLPLDGSIVSVPADAIPAGTFQELELRLAFVRLKGTFDGTAFDVTAATPVRGEIQFTTPLVVAAGTATSITVTVPLATWFTNTDGSLLDPSKLNATPSLMGQFIARIGTSFHAFEDEDHDGHDDHDHSGHG